MEKISLLESLGLSPHESGIYLALVERGPLLVADVAKITGLHRPTIYRALADLQKKEFVAVSPKGKQKRYVAEAPEKLRATFELLRERFEQTLPELQGLYETKKNRPLIKFVEGKRGLAFIADDIIATLKRGDIYYRYTTKRASIATRKYLPHGFYPGRETKQLQRFVITDELTDWQKKPDLNRLIKTTSQRFSLLNENFTQIIYGSKVAVADFETETAFIIENPLFAKLQQKIFKALFELL